MSEEVREDYGGMRERDTSQEAIVAVIENKLDQLISAVAEIKNVMHDNSVDIADLKVKVTTFDVVNQQQQKEIDQINKKNESFKNWLLGLTGSLIVSVVGILAKMLLGV